MISFFEHIEATDWEEVEEVAENVISRTLSAKFGCPVYACLDGASKALDLWGVRDKGLDVVQFKIKPDEIPAKVVNQIIRRTKGAIADRRAMREYLRLHQDIGCNVRGEIVKINGLTKEIQVRINDGMTLEWYGSYPLAEQPPHERQKYKVGMEMEFHIQRAEIVTDHGSQVRITLGRRSLRFVEQLLYRRLFSQGEDLSRQTLKCSRRDLGSYSIVRATSYIPRHIIHFAVKELGERVFISLKGAKINAISSDRRKHVR